MKVYGQLEHAQLEVRSTVPSPTSTGLIYFDTTSQTVKVYNGSGFITLTSSSSGGGGGGISWTNDGPNAALFAVENSLGVFKFDSGLSQVIKTSVLVPSNFVQGIAVSLYLSMYSSGNTGSYTFSANCYLIRNGVSTIDSTALSNPSIPVSTTSSLINKLNRIQLTLSDSAGAVVGTPIVAGDLLVVTVTRTDSSDPGSVAVLATGSEVKFS